jgi:imidazole glycerol-phosphate synthase subunit HisH
MSKSPVDVIDYGGGNIASLLRCLTRLEIAYKVRTGDDPPTGKYPLMLPGVGAFGAVMDALRERELDSKIQELTARDVPILGICVGLQLLFRGSQESPGNRGLALLPGEVVKFQTRKVPQIGWNRIEARQPGDHPHGYVYFVNSYYAVCESPDHVWYEADYEGPFCAAVRHKNVAAFQFHPEKSGQFGHDLIASWYESVA